MFLAELPEFLRNISWPEFTWTNINAVLVLLLLEMLLSGDNALVLAIMVRRLPAHQQRAALLWGLWGAFVLRAVCLGLAAYLIKYWFLQTIGALYLLWLMIHFFLKKEEEHHEDAAIDPSSVEKPRRGFDRRFWGVVLSVELTDLAFAIDSIIVAVGVSSEYWVVVTGGFLGLLAMRFVADICVRLLRKFPALEATAYLLVGWVGVKLLVLSFQGFCYTVLAVHDEAGLVDQAASAARYPWIPANAFGDPKNVHIVPEWFFWSVTGAILVLGSFFAVARAAPEKPAEPTAAPTSGDGAKPADGPAPGG